MWKNLKNNLDSQKNQSIDELNAIDEDFFTMLDPSQDDKSVFETLCSRQLLIEKDIIEENTVVNLNINSPELVLGELVLFKNKNLDLIKSCASLVVGLTSTLSLGTISLDTKSVGAKSLDKALTCNILNQQAKQNFNENNENKPLACLILSEQAKTLNPKIGLDDFEAWQHKIFTALESQKDTQSTELSNDEIKCLSLIYLLNNKEFDALAITFFIHQDATMSEALMSHTNKLFAGSSAKVESIDHAIMLLGQDRLLCWLAAYAILELGRVKNKAATAILALRRASLLLALIEPISGELAKEKMPSQRQAFLCGINSLLFKIIDNINIENILQKSSFKIEKIDSDFLNTEFKDYLNLSVVLEQAKWQDLDKALSQLKITERQASAAFWAAIKWEGTI